MLRLRNRNRRHLRARESSDDPQATFALVAFSPLLKWAAMDPLASRQAGASRALWLAGRIDGLNAAVAGIVRWGLLANALLIAVNAVMRKLFSVAWSTAFDMQWHFFAAVVLLMAAYTFQRDEHVRIDLFAQRLGERRIAWLDFIGIVLILLPVCALMVWATWSQFLVSLLSGESRASRESLSDLPAWIIKGFIPLGFFLLGLQGIAGVIRCVAFLRWDIPRPPRHSLIEGWQHDG